jgi:uncharacterized cupredoxin-like copper-binding protein
MKGVVMTGRAIRRGLAVLAGVALLAACAPDSSSAAPVAVELANDHVTLDPSSISKGSVVFETVNVSTDLVHEIEVFADAVDGVVLPVHSTVADVSGLRLLDEIEDIVPGARASLTIALDAGNYLIMCNLPGHYSAGMWAYLTVTEGS